MNAYRVKVNIGGKEYGYVVESPVELTAKQAKQKANDELAEPQRLRAFLQGATLGFGDEMEAGVKSKLSDTDYTEERDRLRAQLASYQDREPLASAGYEIAGAIPPTLLAARSGSPAAAAVPLSRMAQIAKTAAPIAAESALAAYGYSDAEKLGQTMKDIGIGTAFGTVGGGIGYGIQKGIGALGSKLLSFTREKMGDKASDAVQAELRRLVEMTGKNEEEIIQEVMEGKPISDNRTLIIALKNYVNQGGEPAQQVLQGTQDMAQRRRNEAQAALEGGLTQGQAGNQFRTGQAEIDRLKQTERQEYQAAFGESGQPSAELVNDMQTIVQRFPDVAKDLDDLYRARNLVPLFAKDDAGAIVMVRQPAAEDAEILYRGVRDFKTQAFTSGRGAIGEVAGESADAIKSRINTDFPQVGQARQASSVRFKAQEAFEAGRKALSKDPEELEVMLDGMSDAEMKAFRVGVMNALNKKMQTGTTFRDLADENKNIGKILRMSLNPEDVDQIVSQMSRTAESVDIAQRMPAMAGSPTAPLQQEANRSGSGFNTGQVLDALSGSPFAATEVIKNLLQKETAGLSTEQRQQVVSVIMSEDAELVRRALSDNTALAQLEKKIKSIADTIGKSAQRATQQQSIQLSQE